ncbi:MAG TPA: protease pro-enzyme activation domain-containing protein [Thermoplasmata archaeon]|nr:protease pro-enzyme activation domain-containing protein [Thermoplasmata archaeon]
MSTLLGSSVDTSRTLNRPAFRLALPFLAVVIMALSGVFFATAAGTPTLAAGAPHATGASQFAIAPRTGQELQHQPYLSSPGTGTSSVPNATVIGNTPSDQSTMFTVGFDMRNAAEAVQILNEQQTPGSPMFHHWLTLDQEKAMFAPDPTVVQDTINYFTSLGFQVQTQGILSVSFSGKAVQTNSAFRTNMVEMQTATGQRLAVNSLPLSLPEGIAPYVATVNGLNQYDQAQITSFVDPWGTSLSTSSTAASLGAGAAPSVGASAAVAPSVNTQAPPGANVTNISKMYNFTNHAFGWVDYYSHTFKQYRLYQVVTPGALSYLYGATPLLNEGVNGNSTHTPIQIAIIMAGGINPDDLKQYGSEVWNNPNNILQRLSVIPIDGAYQLNGTLYYTDGASGEMALDIEYSSTLAPGAQIIAVYGPGLYTNVLDDDYAKLAGLATPPNIVSNSWGGEEDRFGSLYGPTWENALTMHSYIMLLTLRGSTVLASSADGGGFDKGTGMLSGSYPATDPYVLSVNGVRTAVAGADGNVYPTNPNLGWTNISLAPGSSYENYEMRIATATQIVYQSFWYTPTSNYTLLRAPPYASGGFGISNWFNQSWWQHGPFMPDLGRSLGSGVAAEADFNESIFFDGVWELRYGGTSFACPTTAGMLALVEDYLAKHGMSPYLGNGNAVTTLVGNAWYNGNLTLNPYYDVTNGTSYWGNQGVAHGWSWPPGDAFPYNAYGPVYGNTTVGWDFPTGWGVINPNTFAIDLYTLYSMPGQFTTLTSNGLSYSPSAWGNLALNDTYTLHVNASATLKLSNPHVTVIFTDSLGHRTSFQPSLVNTSLGPGYDFALITSGPPFDSPGYIYFEFGNAANPSLGFAYSWIAKDIPSSGNLQVQVVTPSTSSYPGGSTIYNSYLGWIGNVGDAPDGVAQPYTNTFTVLVTDNGNPVYNAWVTATIPTAADIVWMNSIAAARVGYHGGLGSAETTNIISGSYTNVNGLALVSTVNVIKPTPVVIQASYGPLNASTNYQLSPMPNIRPVDNYGGNYSQFNFINYLLNYFRAPVTCQWEDLYDPNSCAQSDYNSMIYGWQGEELNISVNDYQNHPLANQSVWLGNWDFGDQTRFVNYEPSYGVYGITNTSGVYNLNGGPNITTSGMTSQKGQATLYIPDNMTPQIGFNFVGGPYAGKFAGIDYVAASLPGLENRTFSYSEPCSPSDSVPVPLISCQFNNSFQRNYTTAAVLVFPDPIHTWTQTRAGAQRDFFSTGTNISWGLNVSLPNNDPFLSGPGTNWNPGLEHVVSVNAYVDGVWAGSLSPQEPGEQFWYTYGNLSTPGAQGYAPGIHTLLVEVTDSLGHTFTDRHVFVVGSVAYRDISPSNVYSQMPFNLTWNLPGFPDGQVSNKTFNMSLEIRYVTGGCGGVDKCPQVVNLSIPVHPQQVNYSQSINRSLLIKNNFYSGAGDLPPGQYQLIVWWNANHSGSVSAEASTFLVFDPLTAQINGPGPNALIPLGNVTISYAYGGQYISNAVLSVYSAKTPGIPVYQVGAFLPGLTTRGGSASWTSVSAGAYLIALNLTTPYGNYTAREWVNVTLGAPQAYINGSTGQKPIAGLPIALTGTVLAIAAGVIGLLLGMLLALPVRQNGRGPNGSRTGAGGSAKPWDEGAATGGAGAAATATGAAAGGSVCPICHERFETPYALAQHGKIMHGIEE